MESFNQINVNFHIKVNILHFKKKIQKEVHAIMCKKISATSLNCYNPEDATNFNEDKFEKRSVEKLTSSNIPMPNSFPLVISYSQQSS